jgi:hypothetical protein
MYKVRYYAIEARLEKADCLVWQNDEQASGFFDGGQHTEEVTAAEIEVVLMTATNEVER